jgi:hypothetical protein
MLTGQTIGTIQRGQPIYVQRNVYNVQQSISPISATLLFKNSLVDPDDAAVQSYTINIAPTPQGQILVGSGGTILLTFILPGTASAQLSANKQYSYVINLFLSNNSIMPVESGVFSAYDGPPQAISVVGSVATGATPASGLGPRATGIINRYLDTILHDFRQMRVWDEHARRSGANSNVMRLTYQHWNTSFTPEVYDGENDPIPTDSVSVDYDKGTIQVENDPGTVDFFVTYEFDYVPAPQLAAMLDLTLMEINASAHEGGGFITNYLSVEETPAYWDAPLALGTAVKCFNRLSSDSGLWRNHLIWVEGSTGNQLAKEVAAVYQQQYDDLRKSVKKLHFTKGPGEAFLLFQTVGMGFFAVGGPKFRGLQLNRLTSF